jgi:hypothetical protein
LLDAGFSSVALTQQQFNFCSMVAIKAWITAARGSNSVFTT